MRVDTYKHSRQIAGKQPPLMHIGIGTKKIRLSEKWKFFIWSANSAYLVRF